MGRTYLTNNGRNSVCVRLRAATERRVFIGHKTGVEADSHLPSEKSFDESKEALREITKEKDRPPPYKDYETYRYSVESQTNLMRYLYI